MNKIKTLGVALFAIAIITNIAYSQHKQSDSDKVVKQESVKKEITIGNTFICPVSGEQKKITSKTPKYEYNGKTYYFCCNHCVEEFKKDPAKYVKEEKEGAIIGNKVICPVMKTKFIPTEKSPKTEYKGKIYYFCCADCVEKFKKEPEKYIKSMKTKEKKCSDCKDCDKEHKSGKKCDEHKEEHKHSHNKQMENTQSTIKSFSMDEVSKHNQKGDCWLVINNKVYDVSEFSKKHNENILLGCGKDATKLFETRTDENGKKIGSGRPHSNYARKLKDSFYIGELAK